MLFLLIYIGFIIVILKINNLESDSKTKKLSELLK